MATTFPRAALKSLIATVAGYPADNVRWKTTPKAFTGPATGANGAITGQITLTLLSRPAVGTDEARDTWDPDTATLTREIGGQRRATVSVRCESFDPADPADDVLERIRTKLNDEFSQRALKAAGIAWTDDSSIVDLTYSVDNREVSAGVLDLIFNHVVSFTPSVQPGYIEKVTHKDPPIDPETIPDVDLDDAGTYTH